MEEVVLSSKPLSLALKSLAFSVFSCGIINKLRCSLESLHS